MVMAMTTSPTIEPQPGSAPEYPQAPRGEVVDTFHGVPVPDPYRWLEDAEDPRTVAWLAQQADLVSTEREQWSTRDHFTQEVTALLGAGTISPPYYRGKRAFFTKREPGQQFAVLYLREDDGRERVLIDPIALDPSGKTTLDSWQPSKEGDLLAYQLSVGGDEESQLYVMAVADGRIIEGPIDRCRYSPVAWIPGGEAFYYVRRLPPELLPANEAQFHRRVYLHHLGAPTEEDVLVFGAGMEKTNYYGVEVSVDGRWLQISASQGTEPRNDLWVADLTNQDAAHPALRLVIGDVDAQTSLTFGRDGRVYVFTDLDAPRGRLAVAQGADLGPSGWVDLIGEDPNAVLDGVAVLDGDELVDDLLLVVKSRSGVSQMSLHAAADGQFLEHITLPGVGTVAGPVERIDGGPIAWFVYTDHTTVPTVYEFDARSRTVEIAARPPGSVQVPAVRSLHLRYPSADGTSVGMFIVAPGTGELPDHPRPTILYGYGGFGIPLTPGFSAAILSWVKAGGVWAIANLRGGGEEGEQWHRDGMLANKQNVFDDFHAAAEYLINQGWTTTAQLGIHGGSNGGLLVGAAMTQRPELYGSVVCTAPLLDMIRYTTSELGLTWTVEYGDPEVPEEFAWLYAYSPYHRVQEQTDYPATMVVVFANDTRTDPMHGRKMVAALQHATSGTRPVLLRCESEVGHGARSIDRAVAESAETLAFFARHTGLVIQE
jgi:prolyl oligopeptidase